MMSNSPLVNYTKISPNKYSPRNHVIDTITIHCAVAQCSAERLGEIFAPTSRKASCNYGIGYDGRIALIVDEKDASWCSSNYANDNRAITIEVASDNKHPYAVTDAAYKSLIKLLADICRRNGIKELKWRADKSLIGQIDKQNMTVHRWFANKACPGEYLYSRHGQIASEVNAILKKNEPSEKPTPSAEPESTSTENPKNENYTKIVGNAIATAEQMITYIKKRNPDVSKSVIDMIPLYLSEGKTEGVAGDVAFAQSCLETGNFKFSGSAVTIDQNNFCGMGVTGNGVKGNSFETPQIGIRAQIQHLKAYASTENLVNECVDPRFKYVPRGCAEYVEWLGAKENPTGRGWATGAGYGEKIVSILKSIRSTQVETNHEEPSETGTSFKVGDLVSLTSDAKYYSGADVPNWVKNKNWYISSIKGDRIVINKSEDGKNAINSPVRPIYLQMVKPKSDLPYKVKVDITNLNIRKGPGTNYAATGAYTGVGVFTIVDVRDGEGSKNGWGKLKSGAGWISLDFAKRV